MTESNQNYVILISGRGSNMEALLKADLPGRCVAVISNRPDAGGLAFAAARGVPAVVVNHRDFAGRAEFDAELARQIDALGARWVFLAGFMRILSEGFVRRFEGRLINIHPSLLPSFPGLDTHGQALRAGVRIHGVTVHFVTPELDAGPPIVQAAVPVLDDDTAETLAQRVLLQEHEIYPAAARWLLEGRVTVDCGRVRVDVPQSGVASLVSPNP